MSTNGKRIMMKMAQGEWAILGMGGWRADAVHSPRPATETPAGTVASLSVLSA